MSLTFGGAPLLQGASLSVGPGERVCLVGRNGSGKSTLLKVAAGLIEPDRGERFLQPGATLRYLEQEPDLARFATIGDYVAAGLAEGDDRERLRRIAEALRIDLEASPRRLSGGEGRRAALARALGPDPDILLLDEPTNHLDLDAIEWLEAELLASRAALVLISHDRRFLSTLSRATVWLDRGQTRRLDRGFAGFEEWRDEVLAQEERDRRKLARRIEAEEHWLRYGVTARRKRNERRLEGLVALRREHRDERRPLGLVTAMIGEGRASGTLAIEAKGVGKAYGDRAVVREFDLRLRRGDRLGIVGPNGAGKTTLVKLLTGQLAPDSGTVTHGAGLEMVVLDQGRETLDPTRSLAETLGDGNDTVEVAGTRKHVLGYMKDFLFAPEQARSPVGSLSGGERNRLLLARALARTSNLLVLDEPTNDLDLETLDLLQEWLGTYPGTVVLISHDRDFLDRTVGAILAPEDDGRWTAYAGGYSDMLAQRGARPGETRGTGAAAPSPKVPSREPPPRAFSRKLGFKEQHELTTLPNRIAAMTGRIAALESLLADPDLYARRPEAFAEASAELGTLRSAREEAEERWLELEMRREALEG